MDEMPVISQKRIESRILTIRGVQVMLDRDLAELYQVETRVLNQAVKRNTERFPEEFCFQLTYVEFNNWKSQIVMSNKDKIGLRRPPFAFTEQGIAMLSAVLRSEIAVTISIQIIKAFIELRKLASNYRGIIQRLEGVERKQLENEENFEKVFKALENNNEIPTQGIFFDGQIFDAYKLVSDIVRSAKESIVLIDNYIDESTLTLLSKKDQAVRVILLTKSISKQLELDLKKANQQYSNFQVREFNKSHDRFLIIDDSEVYHLGASLKDLGRKWFAFTKMDKASVESVVEGIGDL